MINVGGDNVKVVVRFPIFHHGAGSFLHDLYHVYLSFLHIECTWYNIYLFLKDISNHSTVHHLLEHDKHWHDVCILHIIQHVQHVQRVWLIIKIILINFKTCSKLGTVTWQCHHQWRIMAWLLVVWWPVYQGLDIYIQCMCVLTDHADGKKSLQVRDPSPDRANKSSLQHSKVKCEMRRI